MPEYAPSPATISGQQITVDRLINNPILIYRLLRTLVQQRLIGDKLLTGRVDLTGSGTAVYEIAEAIMSTMSDEIVGQLAEYPLTGDAPGTIAKADTVKRGLASEISDELIARARVQGPDVVIRKLTKLANRLVFSFDALCLSAIASAVTQTQAASAVWSDEVNANPLRDILLAAAQVDELNQGYVVDVAACRPTAWAEVISSAKVLANTPREGQSVTITGNLVTIGGLNIYKTTNMPAGVNALVADSSLLGSIARENLGGGYQGEYGDVESKRIRLEENDGWKIQTRKVAVPMVQEPGAAVKITGV